MPGIDFALLRRQLALTQVLDLIGFTPTTRCGPQLRGPCPVHGSQSVTSRSFAAHLGKNVWQCFVCQEHGNALDLWAAVTHQRIYAAVLDLYRRLGRQPPRKETSMPQP